MTIVEKLLKRIYQYQISKHIKDMLKLHQPLQQEQLVKYIYHYQKTNSEKSFQKVLFHCIKILVNFLQKHSETFKKNYPHFQLDDIFSFMIKLLSQAMDNYNPKLAEKTKFTSYLHSYLYKIVKHTGHLYRKFDRFRVQHLADKEPKQGSGLKLIDLVPDEKGEIDPDLQHQYQKLRKLIKRQLNPQQRQALYAYFRFQDQLDDDIQEYQDDYGRVTQTSIADKLGVSRSYMSALFGRALNKLRPHRDYLTKKM